MARKPVCFFLLFLSFIFILFLCYFFFFLFFNSILQRKKKKKKKNKKTKKKKLCRHNISELKTRGTLPLSSRVREKPDGRQCQGLIILHFSYGNQIFALGKAEQYSRTPYFLAISFDLTLVSVHHIDRDGIFDTND